MSSRIVTLEAREQVDEREFQHFKEARPPEMLRAHVLTELARALAHEMVKRKLIAVVEQREPDRDCVVFTAKVHVCEPGMEPADALTSARTRLVNTLAARTDQLADPLYVPGRKSKPQVDPLLAVRELDAFVLDLLPKMLPETSGRFALGVIANKLKTMLEAA